MKANKILTTKVPELVGGGHFNLTAIQDDGSPIQTQVWSSLGDFNEAAMRIKQWVHDDRTDESGWNKPVVAVYVHHTRTLQTWLFTPENDPHGLWS